MPMLIADSGSTKTDWRLAGTDGRVQQFQTEGYNPYHMDAAQITTSLYASLVSQLSAVSDPPRQIFFYGSGCANEEKCGQLRQALSVVYPQAKIEVHSDLLGAARALCNRSAGIAAILGTGSNSCYYDGHMIADSRPSLGYALGDEGSGAHIGKQVLRAYLYGDLPAAISERFRQRFQLDRAGALEQLYRKPFPNRFLASFSKFVFQNRDDAFLAELVLNSFRAFFDAHICRYAQHRSVQMHCTGSVGFYFSNFLRQVAEEKNVSLGTVTESPAAGLLLYHLGE